MSRTPGMRFAALLPVLVVVGCGGNDAQPDKVVLDYLQSEDSASCKYLIAPRAKRCRRPNVPDPPARGVVIASVRGRGDRATGRASSKWPGYRRHSTFALVRRQD